MKVVFISNLFPDQKESYRGLDNATLLHELSNEMEFRVLSPRPRLPWNSRKSRQPRDMDTKFCPVYPEYLYVPKFGSAFNDHLFARAIRQPLEDLKREFDFKLILVAWTFPDACAVAKLAPKFRVPFVTIVQGSDAHVYLQMPVRREKIVKALTQASSSITRSAKLGHLLAKAGVPENKLSPVYNGVDLEIFHVGNKQESRRQLGLQELPTILFVGNFLPVKNPFLLIEAHAQLCRQGPRVQLVMIGAGPLESEARQLAQTLGFGDLVRFAGRKSVTEVAEHLRASNLLCLSSENEGVPNVVLEAFASGVPVVTTDVGGISEVLNQPFLGELVPRGDQEALANGLRKWIQADVDPLRIRKRGEHFSWPRAAAEYKTKMFGAV